MVEREKSLTEKNEEARKQARLNLHLLQMKYNHVFSTPEGEIVRADILNRLRFFDKIETEEDRYLHNAAHDLVKIMGGLRLVYNNVSHET